MRHRHLDLDRCPWCKTAKPTLENIPMVPGRADATRRADATTGTLHSADAGWGVFICTRCQKLVLAKYSIERVASYGGTSATELVKDEVFPAGDVSLDDSIPKRIVNLLRQAHDTIHSADACLMVCASALDAMLQEKAKELKKGPPKNQGDAATEQQPITDKPDATLQEKAKELTKGSLKNRIDAAAEQRLITEGMAKWAHQVRLEANDSRHPEKDKPLATQEEAEQCLEFTMALAEILFVLPARVTRGIEQSGRKKQETGKEQSSAPVTPDPADMALKQTETD